MEVVLSCIDSSRDPIHLSPQVENLRLERSTLASFRDLGWNLKRLRVLNASRCGVTDLDGIASLGVLEEVYLSFNDVEDCTAFALHETLEVADLEANRIADPANLQTLGTCLRLTCLTLHGNPVARRDDYRRLVASAIPHLDVLDDGLDDVHGDDSAIVADAIKRSRGDARHLPTPCSRLTHGDAAALSGNIAKDMRRRRLRNKHRRRSPNGLLPA